MKLKISKTFCWLRYKSLPCLFTFPMFMVFYLSQGEEYKVIWPDQQEFIRMGAKFGATIVPFGVVGEDDIAQVC